MWKLQYQGILTGQPKSLGRPRGTRTGRVYMPLSDRQYQAKHLEALGEAPFRLKEEVRVQITFSSKRPQRLMHKKDPEGRIYKTSKPDLDNLIKMVLDILTKWGIWNDDSQVVSIQAEDYYCSKNEEPHTSFQIYIKEN